MVTGADTRLNSAKTRFEQSFEEAVKGGDVPVRLISVSVTVTGGRQTVAAPGGGA